jgi:hypothetical protein
LVRGGGGGGGSQRNAHSSSPVSSPQFLEAVDNHAFLHLDICWCYFKLKDLNYLKDAEWRLTKAQAFLERSYGRDFSRLLQIRGGICPEMIVYLRMLLLRGVLAFHQGQKGAARIWFTQAAQRVTEYQIPDELLSGMVAMGFSDAESRVALRACHKEPDRAITFLLKKREEQAALRAAEKLKHQQKTRVGGFFSFASVVTKSLTPPLLSQGLCDMGFDSKLVVAGLRQTNNDGPSTISLLTQNPEILQEAIARERPDSEEKIAQVMQMGFPRERAVFALIFARGDVQGAISHLLITAPPAPMDGVVPAAAEAPEEPKPLTEEEKKQQEAMEAERQKKLEEERLKQEIEVRLDRVCDTHSLLPPL